MGVGFSRMGVMGVRFSRMGVDTRTNRVAERISELMSYANIANVILYVKFLCFVTWQQFVCTPTGAFAAHY